jgi:hypothetical protein
MKSKGILIGLLFIKLSVSAQLTDPVEIWDSVKNSAFVEVAPAFETIFGEPYRLPLSDYGWEDGLQISYDGLHLYTLYAPADAFSWLSYIAANPGLPICETLGSPEFIRPYAGTYGMDMATNLFGCDTFFNLDILYAYRDDINDEFENWVLSDIARPGQIEGGPFPLQSSEDADLVDHFLFTGIGDIWMINATTANPSGIEAAIRLPEPINAGSGEFNADNPVLRRINNSDTLLLVYEKYFDAAERDFMYVFSYDDGETWENPVKMTSITNATGHLEHPQLHSDGSGTYLYYSRDFDLYRMKQAIPNNWDSWTDEQLLISKGNALAIGEPSVAINGDISFVLVYHNITHPEDEFDIDPWYVRNINGPNAIQQADILSDVIIFPNPSYTNFQLGNIEVNEINVTILNMLGQEVMHAPNYNTASSIDIKNLPSGMYTVIISNNTVARKSLQLVVSK